MIWAVFWNCISRMSIFAFHISLKSRCCHTSVRCGLHVCCRAPPGWEQFLGPLKFNSTHMIIKEAECGVLGLDFKHSGVMEHTVALRTGIQWTCDHIYSVLSSMSLKNAIPAKEEKGCLYFWPSFLGIWWRSGTSCLQYRTAEECATSHV